MKALNFEETDRVPRDLGAMRSTGISAFAYPKLVAALGLPPRVPRLHDTAQMLALPDLDVLDALGCDVVTIDGGVTNAFDEPEKWHDFDFGGRLPAKVTRPEDFEVLPDGTVRQWGRAVMPPNSFVFNEEHSGQPLLDLDAPLPLLDLEEHRKRLEERAITDGQASELADLAARVRRSTDRAVFFADWTQPPIGIGGHCGIGIFPIICKLEPDYVHEFHRISTDWAVGNLRRLLPRLRGNIDIVLTAADDWGTQNTTIASPATFQELFQPYYRRFNDVVHELLPGAKTFMHNCGAVYDVLDIIVDSGFDIVNPVQWPAGGHSYSEWKARVHGRAALWGGGVYSQQTLALGTVQEVENEVRAIVPVMSAGGGYVFNNIHNLLAETPPEKIIAMYRAANRAPGIRLESAA